MSYDTGWIRRLGVRDLGSRAEGDRYPESDFSPGAVFLLRVAEVLARAMDSGDVSYDSYNDSHDGLYVVEGGYTGGTYEMGQTFLDLGAWSADYDADSSDVSDIFSYALDRVAMSLAENLASEAWIDDEDDDDDEYEEEEEEEEPEPVGVIPGLPWVTA